MSDRELAARVAERFVSANLLPTTHSKPFARDIRDREQAAKLYLEYVGSNVPAEITGAVKKLAKAIEKALPGVECSSSVASVSALPSSHGSVEASVTCKSPARSARVLRLLLR